MNDLTPMKSSLPQAAIDKVNGICNREDPFPSQQVAIAELEAGVSAVERLRKWLPSASRSATADEVKKCIAVLVGCFPSGNREPVFVTALIHDVMDEQPSVYALDRACRHLRRTSKFMPAICEVLDAISDQEDELAQLEHRMARIPEKLADYKSSDERARASQETYERAVDMLVRCWQHGVEPSPMPGPSIIEAAKKRFNGLTAST